MSIAADVKTWKFDTGERGTFDYPEGPWSSEPDKAQWVDEATGLDCLIVRNGLGNLCGYVGVTEPHPWFGVGYGDCTDSACAEEWCYSHSPGARVDVHGGLTYSAACMENAGEDAICHVPAPGRSDKVWWFGFDTAHGGDLSPEPRMRFEIGGPDVYRDFAYVTAECASLAEQLVQVSA